MLTKLQTSNLSSIPKTITNPLRYLVIKPICTTTESKILETESPELPSWAKFFEIKHPTTSETDEDFVIPSLASWIETQKLDDPRKAVQQFVGEIIESDVDKISKILKNRYQSKEEVAEALNGCDFDLSDDKVEQILKRFSNDWVPAFGFFTWAKDQTGYRHSPGAYDSMVDILGKFKNFQLMWDLVEEMDQLGGYISFVTMTKIMRRLARARLYKEAIEAFRGMERFGVRKDTFSLNVLMETLVKENSIEHAHEVFLEFKQSIPLNVSTFNILIHGLCKVRDLERARKTMEDMEKQGFQPDVISYTCFIEAYCRDKDFRKVYAFLDEMEKKGCAPNVITYTITMHALGKAKQITEAVEVYERMKKNGCVPDSSFYNSLIFVLGKSGRLKDAYEVFDDMMKQGLSPDVVTYNTMITCACAHSQEETALKLLKKMEDDLCRPDLKTYSPLLKMCCKKKRMKVLNFLLNHMFSNNVSIEAGTYSLLVNGLCKSGKVELACSFFEEMVSKGMVPKDSIYKTLIKVLEAKSMIEAKENIEKLMLQSKENESRVHSQNSEIEYRYKFCVSCV
ncbi:hypothetical protein UlMin_009231 [Ulmus minor]